jgi:hypothetical protein
MRQKKTAASPARRVQICRHAQTHHPHEPHPKKSQLCTPKLDAIASIQMGEGIYFVRRMRGDYAHQMTCLALMDVRMAAMGHLEEPPSRKNRDDQLD